MEVVRANGLDIAYERTGAEPPLVLVHGAGDNSRVWQPRLAASPQSDRRAVRFYEVREGKFGRAQMFHFDTAAVLAYLARATR